MNDASKQGKLENDTAKADKPSNAGTDQDRDKTLTEKSEEEAGGANKKTPGPIYDV